MLPSNAVQYTTVNSSLSANFGGIVFSEHPNTVMSHTVSPPCTPAQAIQLTLLSLHPVDTNGV